MYIDVRLHMCIFLSTCICVRQLWKSQWLQLHSASSRGPVRLEKYASQEAAKQSVDDVHKPIPLASLSSLRKLTVDVRRPAIEITFSDPQMSPFMFCPDNSM